MTNSNLYDVIIVGAGPGGIFCAYELHEKKPDLRILVLEKGNSIEKRVCPKRKTGRCMNCKPCAVTTGFAGAGAFSDGKLSLSPDVGGTLPDLLGYEKALELIRKSDDIYLRFGADTNVYGVHKEKEIREIRAKAIGANLKLVECPIRHLGTEKGYEIYQKIQTYLQNAGIQLHFREAVREILIDEDGVKGVTTQKGRSYYAPRVVLAVGRDGADWLSGRCEELGIRSVPGTVDIGVRVEVRDEIMEFLNKNLYEAKLIYYTPTFDDKVRTFCTNPSGEVAAEYYDDNLAVVNGHAYKGKEFKTNNTNFALLVSKNFTSPFKTPIEYGKKIAQLSNMLCGNRIMVQTFGDFRRGRRTTPERMCRNNLIPTLKDAVPGDLSLVFPHRIMVDLEEMIFALDKVTPGIASDETLLYGVEVKFYSNKVLVSREFETSVKGLYAIGDGAGITRGLQQASANGLCVADAILNRISQNTES
ncbi:MAG: NAD(P)/FAD-dependent oxidoreductase [Eubacteriales bacterium]|nr:NAD(P)/FAD-dependent oxidoreductase [Eubacteriales bacterium]